MNVTEKDILTPAELAAEYRTTKPTVLAWYHKKLIPAAVSQGRVIRFNRSDVARALAASATPASAVNSNHRRAAR